MRFTYNAYEGLIDLLKDHGYVVSSYHDWSEREKCVILRHDIDFDLAKAAEMAKLEQKIGVRSTYFALLTSDFYNVFSERSFELLCEIAACGHEIGLHFDEVRYPTLSGNEEAITGKIMEECRLLESAVGMKITTVSMHRPTKAILEADLKIPGIINSYGSVYFKGFKYLSDSRRRWREPAEDIIRSGLFDRLHILTHAFWYEHEEIDIHGSIYSFVNQANQCRYQTLSGNITDLDTIMSKNEIAGGVLK